MPISTVLIRTPSVIKAIMEEAVKRDASPPGPSDDNTQGYVTGWVWIDETAKTAYILVDDSTGAAVWQEIGAGGGGADWQDSVINRTEVTAPGAPTDGDRYIIAGTGGAWSGFAVNDIAEYNGDLAQWENTTPNEGFAAFVEAEDKAYIFSGAAWVLFANFTGAVLETAYNANTILAADVDDTPTPRTINGGQLVGRTSAAGNIGGVSIFARSLLYADASGNLQNATLSTDEIVGRSGSNEIGGIALGAQQLLARDTGGAIEGKTVSGNGMPYVSSAGAWSSVNISLNSLVGRVVGEVQDISVTAQALLLRGSGNLGSQVIADSEFVGRPAGGDLGAMTAAEAIAILNAGGGVNPTAHAIGGAAHTSSTLAQLNSKISDATLDDAGDARTPTAHATSHQNGGGDEINVAGLSGTLADPQTPTAHAASHGAGQSDEVAVTALGGYPGGGTTYLRDDGTFAAVPAGFDVNSILTHNAEVLVDEVTENVLVDDA